MKKISIVFMIIGLIILSNCTQPTSGDEKTSEENYFPNLPVSSGNNPFNGNTFILFDRDNLIDEKIVFSTTGFTVWELDNSQWEPALQGLYSYNASLSQIYICFSLVYNDTSGWITITDYFDNAISSDIRNQKAFALKCGLDINATKSEIKSSILSWYSEPITLSYTIGTTITQYNTSGYKLQVSGEYDTSLPWYKQRNGNYRGESSSEVDCNISDGYIGWGGYIDYYDSSYHYFITNVSDTKVYFMDILENQTSHQYTISGTNSLAEITLIGIPGSIVLTWEPQDDFN